MAPSFLGENDYPAEQPAGAHPEKDLLSQEIGSAAKALERILALREREQSATRERLRRLERATEWADAARRNFLSIVSHELRTPLTSILGFLELLVGGLASDEKEAQEFLASALESAQELRCVIDKILEMADLEAGEVAFSSEPLSLPMLMQGEIDTFNSQAAAKGISLLLEDPREELPLARGDSRKFRSVIRHLLSNAVKYTSSGSVTLRVRLDRNPVNLRVEIADTGVGFSPEIRDRLTEAFHQAEDPTTRRHGGTGIGLAIALQLVKGMGGELAIDSPGEGRGAMVSFTIPRYVTEPSSATEDAVAVAR